MSADNANKLKDQMEASCCQDGFLQKLRILLDLFAAETKIQLISESSAATSSIQVYMC